MNLKDITRNLIIKILYYTGFLFVYSAIFDRKEVAILCLHQMNGEKFRNLIKFIRRNNSILSLQDFLDIQRKGGEIPSRPVVITFDDGYLTNYTEIFKILKQENIPATFFLTAGMIGTSKLFWWDRLRRIFSDTTRDHFLFYGKKLDISSFKKKYRIINQLEEYLKLIDEIEKEKVIDWISAELKNNSDHPVIEEEKILNWDQVREMAVSGISFGAHSLTHPILTKISLEEASKEIIESGRLISSKIGENVKYFAYPNGKESDFNETIIGIVKDAGYECGLTFIDGFNNLQTDPFTLHRISFEIEPAVIEYKLSVLAAHIKRIFVSVKLLHRFLRITTQRIR